MDAVGCITSDVSWLTGGDQILVCIPGIDHRDSLFSQNHLVALSAASMVDLMTLFIALA